MKQVDFIIGVDILGQPIIVTHYISINQKTKYHETKKNR